MAWARPAQAQPAPAHCVDCRRPLRDGSLGAATLVPAVYGLPLDHAARCPRCFRAACPDGILVPQFRTPAVLPAALAALAEEAVATARRYGHRLPPAWPTSSTGAMSRCRLCLAQVCLAIDHHTHQTYEAAGPALTVRCPSRLARAS